MTPREVLLGAAQVIRERGWYQGWYENSLGCVCVIGAVRVSMHGDARHMPPDWERYYEITAGIERLTSPYGVGFWNDTPGRTVEEVLSVLERAAEAAA